MTKEEVLAFLNGKLKEARGKYGEDSKQVIFVNCAIACIKASEKDGFDIETGHFSYEFCPDQYVGQIGKLKQLEDADKNNVKQGSDFPERINVFDESLMILILESPHKKEFDKKGEPIGPAMGPTGINIRKHILEIFGVDFEKYHLILMNAIPFQCSLGVSPETFRDKMFVETWEAFGMDFFQTRLTHLLDSLKRKGKKVVVVNACTQGNKQWEEGEQNDDYLCCKVCKSIIEILSTNAEELPYFHIRHPSSWKGPNSANLQKDKNGVKNKTTPFPDICAECEKECEAVKKNNDRTKCKECYGKIIYRF